MLSQASPGYPPPALEQRNPGNYTQIFSNAASAQATPSSIASQELAQLFQQQMLSNALQQQLNYLSKSTIIN